MNEYGGLFPDNAKDMMANVPGIGRYSAGAISSIAYNHCEPVVCNPVTVLRLAKPYHPPFALKLDGNVNRLLSRLLALHANPKNKSTLDILWDAATEMVKDSEEPGNINQALIELGATVCKPRDPGCSGCPIKDHCSAYRESQVSSLSFFPSGSQRTRVLLREYCRRRTTSKSSAHYASLCNGMKIQA